MKIAQRFSQARKAANLTQRQIADALNVSVQAVSQWENGKVELSYSRAQALGKLMSVNPHWLMSGEDEDKELKQVNFPVELSSKPLHGHYAANVFRLGNVPAVKGDEIDLSCVVDVVYIKSTYKDKAICILIEGSHYRPYLEENDIAIFDTSKRAENGDVVFILMAPAGFVQINQEAGRSALIPGIGVIPSDDAEGGILIPNAQRAKVEAEKMTYLVMGVLVERRTFPRSVRA